MFPPFHLRTLRSLVLLLAALALAGCASMRATTTLEPDPRAASTLAGLKFRILATEGNALPGALLADMQQHHPGLFSDELDAIPLVLKMQSTPDDLMLPMVMVMVLSGTTIPFPGYSGFHMDMEVTPWGPEGALLPASRVSYTRRDHLWITGLSPLALIPLPGSSDVKRNTSTLFTTGGDNAYYGRERALSARSLREALLKALAALDQQALRREYARRQASMPVFDLDIDGRHYTGRLVPAFSQGYRQPGGADRYLLVLRHREERDGKEISSSWEVPVARRTASGEWEAQRHYVMLSSRPLVATSLLQNGVPARAVVQPVEAPPLADFLDVPAMQPEAAAPVRWSNGILLQIKNSSLAADLSGRALPELNELVTQLETRLLDLNERVGRANDRAQQAIEKGEPPDALRELAVVYRQRGEILKAILGQVRQEAAGRGAP